jgi:hypothetical protein
MTQFGHDPSLGQRPGSLTHNTTKNYFDKVRQDKTSLNRIQKNSSLFTALKYIVILDTAHHGLSRL